MKLKSWLRNNVKLFLAAGLLAAGLWQLAGIKPLTRPAAAEEQAKTVYDRCLDGSRNPELNKETCYAKEFTPVAEARGPSFAFETLSVLQTLDSDAKGCHLIGHGIGNGTYKFNPSDWQRQVNTISSQCSDGAIHGVVEGYVGSLPDKRLTSDIISSICGENPRADCNHIVGHLVLVEAGADVGEALELCGIFREKPDQLFHCYTGIFMEFQTAVVLIAHDLAPKSWLNWPARVEELERMCRSYEGRAAAACWKEIAHAALVKFKHDPQTMFDFCSTAHEPEAAKECRRHAIGIMATNKRFDILAMKDMCLLPQPGDPGFEGDCYVQLAASTLSTLPDAREQVRDFCVSLPQKNQPPCLRLAGSGVPPAAGD